MKEFELSTIRCAVEFGYKGCEKGFNLEKVLADFDRLIQLHGTVEPKIKNKR